MHEECYNNKRHRRRTHKDPRRLIHIRSVRHVVSFLAVVWRIACYRQVPYVFWSVNPNFFVSSVPVDDDTNRDAKKAQAMNSNFDKKCVSNRTTIRASEATHVLFHV
jgi:hypothetical protein